MKSGNNVYINLLIQESEIRCGTKSTAVQISGVQGDKKSIILKGQPIRAGGCTDGEKGCPRRWYQRRRSRGKCRDAGSMTDGWQDPAKGAPGEGIMIWEYSTGSI